MTAFKDCAEIDPLHSSGKILLGDFHVRFDKRNAFVGLSSRWCQEVRRSNDGAWQRTLWQTMLVRGHQKRVNWSVECNLELLLVSNDLRTGSNAIMTRSKLVDDRLWSCSAFGAVVVVFKNNGKDLVYPVCSQRSLFDARPVTKQRKPLLLVGAQFGEG
jgi:hypothetical protein